jgi:general secretion pathway protein D
VDLVTNKRVITTSVLIRDGGTLVLGGLIQDSSTNSEQRVPFLGRIPLLGELFRTRDTAKNKTNFLIFLQPRILRDDAQAAIETDAKYNYVREEQRRVNRESTLIPLEPYQPANLLPPIDNGQTRRGVLSPDAGGARAHAPAAVPASPATTTPLAPAPGPADTPPAAAGPAP